MAWSSVRLWRSSNVASLVSSASLSSLSSPPSAPFSPAEPAAAECDLSACALSPLVGTGFLPLPPLPPPLLLPLAASHSGTTRHLGTSSSFGRTTSIMRGDGRSPKYTWNASSAAPCFFGGPASPARLGERSCVPLALPPEALALTGGGMSAWSRELGWRVAERGDGDGSTPNTVMLQLSAPDQSARVSVSVATTETGADGRRLRAPPLLQPPPPPPPPRAADSCVGETSSVISSSP
mmetsp:Transcript_27493/g.74074  ORF Transcript_27493/g.74074 Transcript_27493/m.74074 type:complete len:237 (-) Transcript_27493:446-1156(-)